MPSHIPSDCSPCIEFIRMALARIYLGSTLHCMQRKAHFARVHLPLNMHVATIHTPPVFQESLETP